MDGHIAYNEPGSPLDGACHVVNLHQESIESSLDYGFDHIEDVPTQRCHTGNWYNHESKTTDHDG